ncbi:uncharacterized protein N7518_007356 [Penicillium psychrosexuale]|uniref:uncharacterized protein n=1 Tax=Penicillium psychrosexuale TaxID=1002107 RepID=UPI002544FCFA|nr:uncharacterized protein N7518_007356 [Penicillium psychrosexuale]KAJ5790345.1 hypothetical protein N7518_007356 [Penicillium psychrosexuale]
MPPKGTKCKLDEHIVESPQLQLPSGLDIDSPSALFSLFVSDDIFEFISQSTNEYARRRQAE